jgi:hypothetical protein
MNGRLTQLCGAGLALVPIPPINGNPTKAPTWKGWNQPRSADNKNGYSANADDFIGCNGCNFGLYHGASNMLALDLDDLEQTTLVLKDVADTDIPDWLDDSKRFEIKSPKQNRGKLIFKLPAGIDTSLLGVKQLKQGQKVIFELRSGKCQDVIIGRHPEGGDYQIIGNPAAIPIIPDVLRDMLQHWDDWKPCFDSALGIKQEPPKIAPRQPQHGENLPGCRDPIKEFNQSRSVADVLISKGYKPVGRDRFMRVFI